MKEHKEWSELQHLLSHKLLVLIWSQWAHSNFPQKMQVWGTRQSE